MLGKRRGLLKPKIQRGNITEGGMGAAGQGEGECQQPAGCLPLLPEELAEPLVSLQCRGTVSASQGFQLFTDLLVQLTK